MGRHVLPLQGGTERPAATRGISRRKGDRYELGNVRPDRIADRHLRGRQDFREVHARLLLHEMQAAAVTAGNKKPHPFWDGASFIWLKERNPSRNGLPAPPCGGDHADSV